MKVSGFSVGRNIIKFGYPAIEAIMSIMAMLQLFQILKALIRQ